MSKSRYEPHFDNRDGCKFYFVHLQVDNKRKYFGLGTDYKQAQSKLRDLLRKRDCGELFGTVKSSVRTNDNGFKDIALRELAHKHLEWCENNNAKGTYEQRKNYVNQFLKYLKQQPGEDIVFVSQITKLLLEEYHQHAKTRGYSANAGNEHMRHIKTMFLWGYNTEICDLPFRKFPEIKYKPTKTEGFSDNEIKNLLAVVSGEFRDMVLFSLYTGLRPIELRLLKKEQVQKTVNGCYEINIRYCKATDRCKTPRPRSVALSSNALKIFQRQVQQHPDSPYVFLDINGKPYEPRTLRQKLQRKCARADIKNSKTTYSLRHTFGNIAGGCMPEPVGKSAMGHTQSSTYARYTKNVQSYHKEGFALVAKKVNSFVKKAKQVTTQNDRVNDRVAVIQEKPKDNASTTTALSTSCKT